MKKIVCILAFLVVLVSCNKDKYNNNNPYLDNYSFSMDVDKNLPLYSGLQNPGNAVKVYPVNGPVKGVIIFNTGSGYKAYDGSCPNQQITTCSALTYNSTNAVCSCDNASYNMYTGVAPGKEYPLKEYRTEVIGTVVRVYN